MKRLRSREMGMPMTARKSVLYRVFEKSGSAMRSV